MMNDIIKIAEPFYSAGRKYGWLGSPIGIGLAEKLFKADGTLRIKIGAKPEIYFIDKRKAVEFIRKHKSIFMARNGVKLGVIALSEFTLETK